MASYKEKLPVLLEALVRKKREKLGLEKDLELAISMAEKQDVTAHNEVAKLGVLQLLSRYLVKAYQPWMNKSVVLPLDQVQKFCLLLLLFLQCSDSYAMDALETVAHALVPTLLWIVVDHHRAESVQGLVTKHKRPKNNWAKSVVYRISKLSLKLDRIDKGERLIMVLQRILCDEHERNQLSEPNANQFILSREAMRLLDGLARHEENKKRLMDIPDLSRDVVKASTVCAKGRKQCCATLDFLVMRFCRKLSWETRNKLRLTKTKGFVKLLLTCSVHPSIEIRKEALGTLWMLSFDAASVQVLTTTANDTALKALLKAAKVPELQSLALPSLHRIVRRKAPKHKSKMLVLLSNDSLTRPGGSDKDMDGSRSITEVQTARLVESLCRSTSVNEPCHSNLMDALTSMSLSSSAAVRYWAAKAFQGQAIDKLNQFFLARTPAMLRSIVMLVKDPVGRVREKATLVVSQLASQRMNAKLLGYNCQLLDALLLNARIRCTSSKGPSPISKTSTPPTVAARLSVQGILTLASQEPSRERIAKYKNCMATLAAYGVSQDGDVELRKAALHGVIMLAHLL